MPTYEYRCARGHTFEVFQKMSDEPVATCTECGEAAERVLSGGGGFLFKGAGFYITDYRSEDYKKKAQAEKPQSSDAASSEKSKNAGGSGGGSGGSSSGGSSSGGSSSGGSSSPGGS